MIAALLLAAAAPQTAPDTAVDAERAFAADAQAIGQWTAFRKWAADDAMMFVPNAKRAQDFLKLLKDPAKAVEWWPTASYVSCDGTTAANTGGAVWPDGHSSYFSTIWQRQADGAWRWRLDHGADLAASRARAKPVVRRAACGGRPTSFPRVDYRAGAYDQRSAPDGTLTYLWHVSHTGARTFEVFLWNGREWEQVIDDRVAAPATR